MKLSLCCISNILSEQGTKFRKMTFKSFSSMSKEDGLKKISEITIHNLNVTFKTIEHCVNLGISGYRMSSDIIPLITHPQINISMEKLPCWKFIREGFDKLSALIKETNIRISAHPSEYITLTSDNPSAINNSIADLELHAEIFDKLDLPMSYLSPLNIHIRKDGDIETLYSAFMSNFNKLSESVKKRLVLENNDNKNGTWSVKKLVEIFHKRDNIPITFDNLHHYFLSDCLSEEEAFNLAYGTWNCQPVFHYSESKDGTKAHADLPESIPNIYNKDVLLDVELKGKDLAIIKLQKSLSNLG
jgi:UV DNA damage endonuclease